MAEAGDKKESKGSLPLKASFLLLKKGGRFERRRLVKARECVKMVKNQSAKGPSQRQLKVAEEIRHILAELLLREELFTLGLEKTFLMITRVNVSPDLSYAKVFFRSIGQGDAGEIEKALNTHKGFFRKPLGQKMRLRVTPDLAFKIDESFDEAQRIEELLNRPDVRRDVLAASEEETEE